MCIFCGGACGGVVDMALPSIAAGVSLVFFKVKAVKASRKALKSEEEKPVDEAEGGEE
ncbi:MAG: hypothetical protein PHF74_04390 [Dehalococcoidales bacterium]|nr:hypothetical protein [Dehalococcoidales bacterium]